MRYSNSGAIDFTEIEKNAYRLSLTLEITHVDAPRYSNLKSLPETTHYGYATLFRGSTVTELLPIKFVKYRVFDIINNGIWAYHQSTEDVATSDSALVLALKYYLTEALPELATGFAPGIIAREVLQSGPLGELGFEILTRILEAAGGLGEELPSGDSEYRAFPIASPFPDIVKFKADIPCSFLFRLESWYLVNPVVYIVDNPTDSGDETEGENEYPEPEQGDGEGDGSEFPPSSPIPVTRDPRDFDGSNLPPIPPPFEGGQCETAYRFQVKVDLVLADDSPLQSTSGIFVAQGPIRGVFRVSSEPLFGGGPGLVAETGSGRIAVAAQGGAKSIAFGGMNLLERVDGEADNCGNPLPGATL